MITLGELILVKQIFIFSDNRKDSIELPKGVLAILFTEWTKPSGGEICSIQVVNPEAFLRAPELDDIEVNGYNVKELIREAYWQLNIEKLTEF